MIIIQDTREQTPYEFIAPQYKDVITQAGTLSTGDYSILGFEDKVSVERKEMSDLLLCLGRERDRFKRELQRAKAFDSFAIVIECSWANLAGGGYRSKLNPHAACQSVLSFMNRYNVPFIFAGGRLGGEYVTWGFLRQYLAQQKEKLESIEKHLRA